MPQPQILYIDAYDSFSNNIITLLQGQLRATITSIKIDDHRFVLNDGAFHAFLDGFDAVVAGPGPGHPANSKDVGLISKLWGVPENATLPVLGICLGFQSLCLAFGARVERLTEPRHGLVTPVTHCESDMYRNGGKLLATQYHSLHVRLDQQTASDTDLWSPTNPCPNLLPLAWDLSDTENGPILMAAKHLSKPFWGVQYHPESICTNEQGKTLVREWWREVCASRGVDPGLPALTTADAKMEDRIDSGRTSEDFRAAQVHWQSLPLPKDVDVVELVDFLREDCEGQEPLLLESGTRDESPVNPETGRFSIIGVQNNASIQVRYSTGSRRLSVTASGRALLDREATVSDVSHYLDRFITDHKAITGPEMVPFWGGLVGYISYEAGLVTMDVEPHPTSAEQPDIWLVFVERSVVVDHVEGILYVQSLAEDDWVLATFAKIQKLVPSAKPPPPPPTTARIIHEPSPEEYMDKVRACQCQLRAGESYELCLTDSTLIHTVSDPWSLYRRLRHLNPAPFGAYLHFSLPSISDLTIASSSPERFLSWTRDGTYQFRPIKGTVKKTPDMTRAKAEAILRSPKEQAENLMIVDLIRHDLSGVEGLTNVEVPKLMSIEEYATVYQLVSVITGTTTFPTTTRDSPTSNFKSTSVLAASLPPGSMTGAPKKRSCQLLRSIEGTQHTRGVYSGVIGYLDVGGGGDFSVAIRTAFRWGNGSVWSVGAGGAVTVLSEAEAEWEEMRTKRESVLRAFGLGGGD